MFRNAYYNTKTSQVYLWETIKGERRFEIIDWVPYIYVPDENGNTTTIDGHKVSKKTFGHYDEYQAFQKANQFRIYENDVPREIQFLAERYHDIPDDNMEVPDLKIYSIDIEVHSEAGFPKPNLAEHPVVLINVREFGGGKNITWGIKPYTGDNTENIEYYHCKNEADLLLRYFDWWNKNAPDVVTGWNITPNNKMNKRGGFDFPYLINRSKRVFGIKSDVYKKLSPIGVVRCWDDDKHGSMYVDIAGVSIIDYMAVYKWYSPKNPENYKLDTISRFELDLGKLDYSEYTDLRTLYHENFNLYVDYNAVDNKRIEELEDALGYIRLAQSLALLCKYKMENYTAATHQIEGLMMVHYRRNGLAAPRMIGGNQEWFPAAFVKPPQVGAHPWVVDLDIASSYPTAIITLNMSPETYFGRCISYMDDFNNPVDMLAGRSDIDIVEVANRETPITEFVKKRKFPKFSLLKNSKDGNRETTIVEMTGDSLEKFNTALEKGLIAVAPCGSMFITNRKGHMAKVEQETYAKRKHIKGLSKQAFKKARAATDPAEKLKFERQGQNYHALQWALKIVLNGMYGVTGVPYSRYFNMATAEAIASCGRRAILDGQRYVNRFFQEGHWVEHTEFTNMMKNFGEYNERTRITQDMVAYVDTDSVFIRFGHFMERAMGEGWDKKLEEEETIQIIIKMSQIVQDFVNDCAYLETQVGEYNSQVPKDEFSIEFKQEIVCKTALFITKKKYGYHVVNNEGVPEDKIDVTGMEIIRSETPSAFREALSEMLSMILRNQSDDEIFNAYRKHKTAALEAFPEEISENKGMNGLEKYIVDGQPVKGTPYHVKAAHFYNILLDEMGIADKYPAIEDDTKNKLVYVRPNPYNIKCIMYDRWPAEFTQMGVVADYTKMIDKFLTQKLRMLLEPAGREHILEKNQAFDLFFGG